MASIRTSTIVYASIGTALAGALAYAVYFDHRRRSDPNFRKALKRESKKQARAAQVEAASEEKKLQQQLRAMVDAANEEGYPTDAEDKERLFMEEVGQGEQLCQDNSTQTEAALAFFKALKVYPQPKELMNIYDKTVPKPVLDLLAVMVAYDRTSDAAASSSSSAAGVE